MRISVERDDETPMPPTPNILPTIPVSELARCVDTDPSQGGAIYKPEVHMLTESEIIAAVCRYLKRHGWTIKSVCNELQRGDDILAEYPASGRTAVIEAKGETSSKASSRRHGKPFNSAQMSSHVSRAFYRAAQAVGGERLSAIALPRTALHIDRVRRIEQALRLLNLEVFWVSTHGRVTREGIWNAELAMAVER